MINIKKYMKMLLLLTICDYSCYSTENNKDNEIENYYGMTFQEFNKKLVSLLEDIDFKIEITVKYTNRQINDIFQNGKQNNITKVFQNSINSEYGKLKLILREIKQRYNESLNTNNKKMNIKDLVIQYSESIFNIDTLFKDYIQKNTNSNNYYNKTISYFKKYDYDKELLQEVVTLLNDMIVKGKLFYNLWMSFYVEYKKYYGQIFDFSDWEII